MRKGISLLLTIVIFLSIMIPATHAASNEATAAADTLYELGLFSGTGTKDDGSPIYELDRAPSRSEAVTMLVRLLGKKDEALSGVWHIPFIDVDGWAVPFVGYAFQNKLTAGTSATTYGGDDFVTAAQYITFVLRALGYESGSDFQWDAPWVLSDEIGLTDGRYDAATQTFLRGDVAIISRNALFVQVKDRDVTLGEVIETGEITHPSEPAEPAEPDEEENVPEEMPEEEMTQEELLQGIWYGKSDNGTEYEWIIDGNTFSKIRKLGDNKGYYEKGTFVINGTKIARTVDYYYFKNGTITEICGTNLSEYDWCKLEIESVTEDGLAFVYEAKGVGAREYVRLENSILHAQYQDQFETDIANGIEEKPNTPIAPGGNSNSETTPSSLSVALSAPFDSIEQMGTVLSSYYLGDCYMSGNFRLIFNSVDGIILSWGATNLSSKTIKYLSFRVEYYNSVDDRAYDDISYKNYKEVQLIGPIEGGESFVFRKLIGYGSGVAYAKITDVTIEYMDGTKVTGTYGYTTWHNSRTYNSPKEVYVIG